jgi:thiosulfate/3-mercaptopyruvate sulfurtransferase
MKMSRIPIHKLAILALLATPVAVSASDNSREGPPLISFEVLQKQLNDPRVRLLDARPKADYDQGHIPGAVWVDTKALRQLGDPEVARDEPVWAKTLAPLGLGENTRVVYAYDSARQHDAARVWWALSYAGVARVGLVDGGFTLWEKEKRPVSTEANVITDGAFRPDLRRGLLASRGDVKDSIAKADAQLLDARSAEEYRGERRAENSKATAGHIPGARNLDGYRLVDVEGRVLDKEAQARLFREAGVALDRPVIAYSQAGNR